MTEEVMKTISLEVVREKMLDHIHQVILLNNSLWELRNR
jgi:hypothetical protein